MVALAVGEVAPHGGVVVCSGEDDGMEDSVAGWEVLAVAASLTTSMRLRRGVVPRTPAPRAVQAEAEGADAACVGVVVVPWRWYRGLGRRGITTCSRRRRGRSLAWGDGSCPRPARRAPDAAPGLEGSEDGMAVAWEEEEDGGGSATYGRGWLGFPRCRPSSTSMPGRGTHGANHGT